MKPSHPGETSSAGSPSRSQVSPASRRTANLDNISVVLVNPQHSGNIGAVARAMKNMGLRHLALVRPHAPLDELSIQMACGADDVLRNSLDAADLNEALQGVAIKVATTARLGRRRRDAITPHQAGQILAPLTDLNKIALLFGPERTGLHNDVVHNSEWVVHIPTHREFRSLNLAQSVLIVCYELFLASVMPQQKARSLATQDHLEGMYKHIRDTLLRIGFLDPKDPERMMIVLRRIFGRAGLDSREVKILRGIMRQMDWYRQDASPVATDPSSAE